MKEPKFHFHVGDTRWHLSLLYKILHTSSIKHKHNPQEQQQQQQQQQAGAAVMEMNKYYKNSFKKMINTSEASMTMVVLLIIFQYIFKMEFVCPCDVFYSKLFCGLYLVLPSFVLILVMILIEPRFTCNLNSCKKSGCCLSIKQETGKKPEYCLPIFRIILPGSVWVINALFDGGVVVCLIAANANATDGKQGACVDVTRQSPEQQWKVNLARIITFCFILIMSIPCAVYICCHKNHEESKLATAEAGELIVKNIGSERANDIINIHLKYDPKTEKLTVTNLTENDSKLKKAWAEKCAQLKKKIQPPGTDDSQTDRGETQNPSNPESNPLVSPHSP